MCFCLVRVCVFRACFLVCVYVCVFLNSKTKAHLIICLGCVFKEFLNTFPPMFFEKEALNKYMRCHVFLFSACVRV